MISISARKKKSQLLLYLLVVLLLAALGLRLLRRAAAEEYRTFWSPTGEYKVVVYSLPVIISVPGASGDNPGYVRLYDRSGRILEEQDVDMVQNIDQVYWDNSKVNIKLLAEWDLPQ